MAVFALHRAADTLPAPGGASARAVAKAARYEHIDFTPPAGVRAAARRGLEVRADAPASQRGGTAVGVARARDLANGRTVSPETARRIKAYFDRHQGDRKGATWDDQGPGWQSWQLWGGDAGWAWARKLVRQMEAADAEISKHLAGKHNQKTHGRGTATRAAYRDAYTSARKGGASVGDARAAGRAAAGGARAGEKEQAAKTRTERLQTQASRARQAANSGMVTEAQKARLNERADRLEARARGERVGAAGGKGDGITPSRADRELVDRYADLSTQSSDLYSEIRGLEAQQEALRPSWGQRYNARERKRREAEHNRLQGEIDQRRATRQSVDSEAQRLYAQASESGAMDRVVLAEIKDRAARGEPRAGDDVYRRQLEERMGATPTPTVGRGDNSLGQSPRAAQTAEVQRQLDAVTAEQRRTTDPQRKAELLQRRSELEGIVSDNQRRDNLANLPPDQKARRLTAVQRAREEARQTEQAAAQRVQDLRAQQAATRSQRKKDQLQEEINRETDRRTNAFMVGDDYDGEISALQEPAHGPLRRVPDESLVNDIPGASRYDAPAVGRGDNSPGNAAAGTQRAADVARVRAEQAAGRDERRDAERARVRQQILGDQAARPTGARSADDIRASTATSLQSRGRKMTATEQREIFGAPVAGRGEVSRNPQTGKIRVSFQADYGRDFVDQEFTPEQMSRLAAAGVTLTRANVGTPQIDRIIRGTS